MPFWYALTFLLSGSVTFYARPAGTPGHSLALSAVGLFAAMIVYTVLLAVPINNQIARWQPDSLPANWRVLRRRWDTLHAVRTGVLLRRRFCWSPLASLRRPPDLAFQRTYSIRRRHHERTRNHRPPRHADPT